MAGRFGFIFLICATGKTAEEMLAAVRCRLHNQPAEEVSDVTDVTADQISRRHPLRASCYNVLVVVFSCASRLPSRKK